MAQTLTVPDTWNKTNQVGRVARTGAERFWFDTAPTWPEAERRRVAEPARQGHPSLAAYAAAALETMRADVIKATTGVPGGASPLVYKVRSGQRLVVEPLVGVALETVTRDPVRADQWAAFAMAFVNLLSRVRTEARR